jgi:hypothetical protein
MTLEQHEIFGRVLDANWNRSEAVKNNDLKAYQIADMQYSLAEADLVDSMGQEAYDAFINQGKKLFSNTKN